MSSVVVGERARDRDVAVEGVDSGDVDLSRLPVNDEQLRPQPTAGNDGNSQQYWYTDYTC